MGNYTYNNPNQIGLKEASESVGSLADFLKQKQQFQQVQNLANRKQQGEFLEKGISPDASGLTPYGQSQQNTQIAGNEFKTAGYNPASPRSNALTTGLQGLAPGIKTPVGVAAEDLEKVQPTLDTAIKAKSALDVYGKKQGVVQDKVLQTDQSNMRKDPGYSAAQQGLDEGEMAKTMLDQATKNPIAGNVMPIIMAKLQTGSKRVPVQEVAMYGGSKAFDARIAQAMQQATTGTLTTENHDFLSKIVDADTATHRSNKQAAVLRHSLQRSQRTHSPINQSMKELTGEDQNSVLNTGQGVQPPAPPVGFEADIANEIQRRQKAK